MSAPAAGGEAAAPRSRGMLIGVVLTSSFAAIVALALGGFLAQFAPLDGALIAVLVGGWFAVTSGRLLAFIDLPKNHGAVWAELGLGLGVGLGGLAAVNAFFVDGPSAWALLAGVGWGVFRAHRPILRHQREDEHAPRPRIGGILDPREIGALVVLAGGYGLMGLGLYHLFVALAPIIPESGKAATLGIAAYAIYGIKLLLRFAAHDSGPTEGGFLGWFKATLLRNAIIVLVLVAYVAYRDDLAANVQYFPLIEFGLGMAAFGAVLAGLRHRLRRTGADHASASDARPHVQLVEPMTEGEYEALARPLGRFLETGRGASEYEAAVRDAARLDRHAAPTVLDPVRRYRPPVEDPPLPLAWSVGAALAAGLALAVGAGVVVIELADASHHEGNAPLTGDLVAIALQLGLLVLGLAVYRTQDFAREHRQPWQAMALAAAGAGIVALAGVLFLTRLPEVPTFAWGILGGVALVMIAIPVALSLALARRMEQGVPVPQPAEMPSALLTKGLQAARRLGATAAVSAVVLLVLVPFVLGWLAGPEPAASATFGSPEGETGGLIPRGAVRAYEAIAAGVTWLLIGMGASALLRFYGYSRARPYVAARERRWREERLALHADVMRRMERI